LNPKKYWPTDSSACRRRVWLPYWFTCGWLAV